jgi:hypothetical protein
MGSWRRKDFISVNRRTLLVGWIVAIHFVDCIVLNLSLLLL